MCAINPKRKQFFRLEFYTAHPMTDERWKELLSTTLIQLEQEFNKTGEIRVHITDMTNP